MTYAAPEPDAKTRKWQHKIKYILPTVSDVEVREMIYFLQDVEREGMECLLNDIDGRIRAEKGLEGTWGRVRMQLRGYWGL